MTRTESKGKRGGGGGEEGGGRKGKGGEGEGEGGEEGRTGGRREQDPPRSPHSTNTEQAACRKKCLQLQAERPTSALHPSVTKIASDSFSQLSREGKEDIKGVGTWEQPPKMSDG